MKDTAVKWDLEKHIRYNSRVTDSIWNEESGKWKVKIEHNGHMVDDECDVLINGAGFLK
jgi:cation diffusion facilitator CzcD-associated flavoprotein CzcO